MLLKTEASSSLQAKFKVRRQKPVASVHCHKEVAYITKATSTLCSFWQLSGICCLVMMKSGWTLSKWFVSWNRNKKLSTGEVNFWCVDEASESVWCLLTPFPLDSISLHMLGLAQGITRDLSPSSAPCQEAATRPEPWARRARAEQGSPPACRRWRMSLKRLMSLPRQYKMWGRGGAQEMACNLHL